jgi:hypothetical protein
MLTKNSPTEDKAKKCKKNKKHLTVIIKKYFCGSGWYLYNNL